MEKNQSLHHLISQHLITTQLLRFTPANSTQFCRIPIYLRQHSYNQLFLQNSKVNNMRIRLIQGYVVSLAF